jgi:hypothetical protein
VATWRDVERISSSLEGARPGRSPDGEPTYDVGRHPFARLRLDEDREVLQYWSLERDSDLALADRADVFFRVDTFKVKVSVHAWLERLDVDELAEILVDSWRARRGVRG